MKSRATGLATSRNESTFRASVKSGKVVDFTAPLIGFPGELRANWGGAAARLMQGQQEVREAIHGTVTEWREVALGSPGSGFQPIPTCLGPKTLLLFQCNSFLRKVSRNSGALTYKMLELFLCLIPWEHFGLA